MREADPEADIISGVLRESPGGRAPHLVVWGGRPRQALISSRLQAARGSRVRGCKDPRRSVPVPLPADTQHNSFCRRTLQPCSTTSPPPTHPPTPSRPLERRGWRRRTVPGGIRATMGGRLILFLDTITGCQLAVGRDATPMWGLSTGSTHRQLSDCPLHGLCPAQMRRRPDQTEPSWK